MEELEELLKHKNDYDEFAGSKIYRPYSMKYEDWKTLENLINKYKEQEKMIEFMAKAFKQDDIRNEDEIIEYFRKEAKKNEKPKEN